MSFATRANWSAARIAITNQTIADANVGGASSTYSLTAAGLVQSITTIGGTTTLESWALGSFSASSYEAVVTLVSGTLTSGTVGTAVNLSTGPQWNVTQGGVGTKTCSFTIVIRYAGGGANITSASVSLTAQGV